MVCSAIKLTLGCGFSLTVIEVWCSPAGPRPPPPGRWYGLRLTLDYLLRPWKHLSCVGCVFFLLLVWLIALEVHLLFLFFFTVVQLGHSAVSLEQQRQHFSLSLVMAICSSSRLLLYSAPFHSEHIKDGSGRRLLYRVHHPGPRKVLFFSPPPPSLIWAVWLCLRMGAIIPG